MALPPKYKVNTNTNTNNKKSNDFLWLDNIDINQGEEVI
jgi:hypothetical protein